MIILFAKAFYTFNNKEALSFAEIELLIITNFVLSALIAVICFVFFIGLRILKHEKLKTAKFNKIDSITNISNISKFIEDADKVLKNKAGCNFVLVHFDIEKFKMINDSLGYNVGDKILKEIGVLLKDTLMDEHIYARADADNFLVLSKYKSSPEKSFNKLYDFLHCIENLSIWNSLKIKPVITAGVYFIDESDYEIRVAIDMAKLAKKAIKGGYKSNYAIYNENMKQALVEEKKIEDDMYYALENDEFKVYMQPKISLDGGCISGAEALVRWEHPVFGLLNPIKFIPIFEKNGFIVDLDKYVFEQVCINLRKWLQADYKPVPISVNVSRVHFVNSNFVSEYKNIKEKYQIPDALIEIEITESVVFGNLNEIFSTMKDFRENGFIISMDDFGSGYSSLGLLREMPIDTLKLDKVFLNHIEDNNAQIIVNNVVNLAKSLKLNVVAEGVETTIQAEFLKDIGCDMAQGYVFAKPMPLNEYDKLILKKRKNYYNSNSNNDTVC